LLSEYTPSFDMSFPKIKSTRSDDAIRTDANITLR
jgi:hypothetical protein